MVRESEIGDLESLLELMKEFYAETATPLDAEKSRRAFENILNDETLGRVWMLEHEGAVVGYAVMTLGFSMEYGGRDAFLDDLFVRADYRGRGLGRAAMQAVLIECRSRGVRALHLEVDRNNAAAKALYRGYGFVDHDRQLMTVTP